MAATRKKKPAPKARRAGKVHARKSGLPKKPRRKRAPASAAGASGGAYGLTGSAFTVIFAAEPVKVVVTQSVAGGAILGAKLNNRALVFSGGVAHAAVGKGTANTLSWAVVGPPGAVYSIAVTQPSGTGCAVTDVVLGPAGKDGGSCRFNT
jgi:hypothetical protein